MAKGSAAGKSGRGKRSLKAHTDGDASASLEGMKWRVDRLERQIRRLSELVREHAADADRLVQIVAENRELLRQELMAKGSPTARNKKSDRDMNGKLDVLP